MFPAIHFCMCWNNSLCLYETLIVTPDRMQDSSYKLFSGIDHIYWGPNTCSEQDITSCQGVYNTRQLVVTTWLYSYTPTSYDMNSMTHPIFITSYIPKVMWYKSSKWLVVKAWNTLLPKCAVNCLAVHADYKEDQQEVPKLASSYCLRKQKRKKKNLA